jgi:hypothetical protein
MAFSQSGRGSCVARVLSPPRALATVKGDEPSPAKVYRAARSVQGIGEPSSVVTTFCDIYSRIVVRRERDSARPAEHEVARPWFLHGGFRARAARIHRARSRGRVPERG